MAASDPWAAPLEGRLVQGAADQPGQQQQLRGLCVGREADGRYLVRTFDGELARAAEGALRELAPPPPQEAGGFDVAWPEGEASELVFAGEVADCLASRGYCLVCTFLPAALREEALRDAKRRGGFEALRTQLESQWVGEGDATKVLWLDAPHAKALPSGVDGEPLGALEQLDLGLTMLSKALAPFAPLALGFAAFGRTAGLVRLPAGGLEPEPLSPDDVEDGKVEEMIHFVRCRRLSMLHVVECEEGEVELVPLEGSGFHKTTVSVTSNRLLLFRHDLFRYSFWPMGYSLSLQAWVLAEPLAVDFGCLRGPADRVAEAMGLTGPPRPQLVTGSQPCCVASALERMPGSVYGVEAAWAMFLSGGDTAVRWPKARWEEEPYYADDPAAALMGKTYSVHGAFMDFGEVSRFDYDFFGISHEEARWMAVEQRLVLEVGCEALVLAGYERDQIRGQNIGVFVGDVGSEELVMPPYSTYSQDGLQGGVTAARVNYCLDLQGPAASHDTACSSSLMALGFAHWKMRAQGRALPAALVVGVNLHMTPLRYIGLGSGGFLTKKGRCFTFDQSAEGYLRGEGCGGVLLRHGSEAQDREARYAECVGTALNQDGRSASLTAPNGPSQQAVIQMSLRMAQATPEMVGTAECHGTGTKLGDPIEIGALMSTLGAAKTERPVVFTTSKINLGHTEAHAGMAGLVKCALCCQLGVVPPHNHLRELSPHLRLEGFPSYINTEPLSTGRSSELMGVSSFGFGGSNGRADFWGRSTNGSEDLQEKSDYVEVSCPRCLGPMCWLCGVAVPKGAPAVRHRCSLVRADGARYDFCSVCYRGQYKYGEHLQGMGNPGRRIYITGTWTAWKEVHEMERSDDGSYVYHVVLGDTRWERFYLMLDRDRKQALYPAGERPHPAALPRVMGPDDRRGVRTWVVDGRADGLSEGAVYRVELHWGDVPEVFWSPVLGDAAASDAAAAATRPRQRQHAYFLRGSWTAWQLQAMKPGAAEGTVYEATFRIGIRGYEEFQVVRDRDLQQLIYPEEDGAADASVRVCGPNAEGKGKHWRVRGEENEPVRVHLEVAGGLVSLTLSSSSLRTRTFLGAGRGVGNEALQRLPRADTAAGAPGIGGQ